LRRRLGQSQEELAALLGVSAESCRAWDSGRRSVPLAILARARRAADEYSKQHEWLSLGQLASELGVHVATLQVAARRGRLNVRLDTRSVFRRPARRVTRAAGQDFLMRSYGKRTANVEPCLPLVSVPHNYDVRLKHLRRRLRLTQDALALEIGAAGKAVIYQWESRKRQPSPVLWREVERLLSGHGTARAKEVNAPQSVGASEATQVVPAAQPIGY
jgi:DNA-binding transcriptional regulator YiaG